MEKFGHFVGLPKTSWSANNEWMIILEDFVYIDKHNKHWLAPAGIEIDGASIPRVFWTLVGSPYTGSYRNASVIHDAQCILKVNPWADVHEMYFEACRCGGVDEIKAKLMYAAVYHFGPRWINGKSISAASPPTDNEAKHIVDLIKNKNPTLEDIRKM